MKIYACPDECPAPRPDFKNFDINREIARQESHQQELCEWLRANGHAGPHTGKIVMFPVADGYAKYMLADGRRSCLIHLPYGDAYQYPDAEFLPKAEILRRIENRQKLSAMFAKPRD